MKKYNILILMGILTLLFNMLYVSSALWDTETRYFNANPSGTTTGSYNFLAGFEITMNKTANLTSIEEHSNSNQLTAVVCTTPSCSGSQLGIANQNNHYFNFSTPVTLEAGETYYVMVNGTTEQREEINTFNQNLLFNYTRGVANGVITTLGNDIIALWFEERLVNIEINTPLNDTRTYPQNYTINATITADKGISNATLYINDIENESVELSGTTNISLFYKNLTLGNYEIIIQSCNLENECSNTTKNELEIYYYELNSVTYNSDILEGTTEIFSINLTSPYNINSGKLILNGTSYISTKSKSGDYYVFSNNINLPLVNSNINYSFNWNFTLSDNTLFNSSTYTTQINDLNVDDCSSYSTLLFNFSMYDEEELTFLNETLNETSIKLNLLFYASDDNTLIKNYSAWYNQTNPAQVCLDGNLNNTYYYIYGDVEFSSSDRLTEFYTFQKYNLTNNSLPNNINLYNLLTTDGQEFKIIVKDDNFLLNPDVLVEISRFYIDDGRSRVSSKPITDENGLTYAFFVLGDVYYSIRLIKNNEVLAIYDYQRVGCDNVATGDCELNLKETSEYNIFNNYDQFENILYTLSFSESTRTITFDFSEIDNELTTITLNVTKFDNYLNDSICSTTSNSNSDTINCVIPIEYSNDTVLVEIFNNDVLFIEELFTLRDNTHKDLFNGYRVFFMIILFSVFVMMALTNDIRIVMVMSMIGFIFAILLFLIDNTSLIGKSSSLLFLLIAGGLIIYKIRNN